ncbi:MAG: efflux RND transporter periplasmic adaptor subunit [Gemmatimonadales bacterium]
MTEPSTDLSRLRIDRDAPSPGVRRAFRTTLVIAVGVVALIVVLAVWLRGSGAAANVQVAVATVVGGGGPAGSGIVANGYVVARTQASVSAKLPGRLAYLGVSEGSHVTEGEVIARLDNADYAAAVTQADRDQLQREARRAHDVRAQNPQLISQQDMDVADSHAAQSDERARAASSRVYAADAGLRLAQANYENTLIRAPFTGTVLRKDAEVGEVVAPSVGGGLTRGAVVTMADLATLEVEVDVNEAYIARVRGGQPARITLDAYPDTSFRGTVRLIVPTADRQKATVQVKVSILDHDPRILTEMGARVEFLETARGPAAPAARPRVAVPAEAVHSDGGATVVWLVKEGRLERREVEAGPVSGGIREVRSGLTGGEVLLLSGVAEPREGMKVKAAPRS